MYYEISDMDIQGFLEDSNNLERIRSTFSVTKRKGREGL